MGYKTYYDLAITGHDQQARIEELRRENENAEYALANNGERNARAKWYGHEEDLKGFSARHPNNTFILSGEGEEFPDLWKKRFVNGIMSRIDAIITYPDFK